MDVELRGFLGLGVDERVDGGIETRFWRSVEVGCWLFAEFGERGSMGFCGKDR